MLQLRFHFGERDRCGDGPLDMAVMDACARRGVRAAALLRGVEGFGAKHQMRTDRMLSLSEDAPLVAVAVGEAETIEGLAEEVRGMAAGGLVVLEEVSVPAGPAATSAGMAAGAAGGAPRDEKDLVRATIWGPRSGPRSPHLGAVAALHRHGAEAAMVLLGVDGVLGGERRRARFAGGNREVPALTVAVGERSAVEAALAEVDGAVPLVTFEAVAPYSRYPRGRRHGAPAVRVTLVTSEIAASGGRPRYVEFIHRLRAEGAAGATALRGVFGFRGDVAPHGDRVLGLRRDVPMLVEVVDLPARAERWREIALELADGDDVVTSRPVRRILTLE